MRISVRNLVEFILRSGNIDNRHKGMQDASAMQEGSKIHRMIQRRMGMDYHAEYFLRYIYPKQDYDIVIEGRADGIIFNEKESDQPVIVDEIKSTFSDMEYLKKPVEVHLAQAKCYAYIFAEQKKLREIGVRMTYCNVDTQEIKYFHETCLFVEIRNWFMEILDSYARWADFEFHWKKIRDVSIKNLQFPFPYRTGQKELAAQVYRTIYHQKRLFIEAPTGSGKTLSTVFPSVKAMGEGRGDQIFYLTAKTITRTAAKDCFDILRGNGLQMKTVIITAKEKICPLGKPECNPEACPYAKGHYDRVNDAIYDLLMQEDSFSRDKIEEYAKKHTVCPFEMGLDMSLFADAVICDYNYVFDPNVYLRRFFGEGAQGEYLFLIDEAHNLVERAMDMYSATLYKESFLELKHLVEVSDKKLGKGL
ncbi:MAG TPA: DEAD/DEAH box helicase family protein, partial [Lachnospiraceae bacterium]|nr:DEAD/DEAH box helicase family protein [Lachnospiraceae bacterium]